MERLWVSGSLTFASDGCASRQAKGKERQWLKNQAYGDLDDAKLIEGLTGEKAIYKRRGEKEPEVRTVRLII